MPLPGPTVFETGALNRSANSPGKSHVNFICCVPRNRTGLVCVNSAAVATMAPRTHQMELSVLLSGARGGIRTRTAFRPPPPQDGASTSFATRAGCDDSSSRSPARDESSRTRRYLVCGIGGGIRTRGSVRVPPARSRSGIGGGIRTPENGFGDRHVSATSHRFRRAQCTLASVRVRCIFVNLVDPVGVQPTHQSFGPLDLVWRPRHDSNVRPSA